MSKNNSQKGFTLLEMLLVIAIIAILAAIVIVAINPARQLAQARNAQRASDLNTLNKAIQQYYIDNKAWPDTSITATLTDVCGTGGGTTTGCLDFTDLVPDYIAALPENPSESNYKIAINSSNKIALTAPGSDENGLDGVTIGTSTAMLSEEEESCDDLEGDDRRVCDLELI